MHAERSIIDVLIEEQLVTPEQVNELLANRRDLTVEVDELAVQQGLISQADRCRCLGLATGIPFHDLRRLPPSPAAASSLSARLASRFVAVPVDLTDFAATVAMANPLDLEALDALQHALNREIDPMWAVADDIKEVLVRTHGKLDELANLIGELAIGDHDIELATEVDEPEGQNAVDMRLIADDAPAIKLANALISRSVKVGASDIHIEPGEKSVRVRFRIDGLLQEVMQVPKDLQRSLISRLKVIAGLDIAERRVPQDGRITMYVQEGSFDLRVATYPCAYGEKMIIRVLNKAAISMQLTELGIPPQSLMSLIHAAEQTQGLILVNGPTGSGKTTTLYSVLNHLNRVHRHIITIEDPIEYRLDGIVQGNVNNAAGLTFARGLRAMLRADPDVILVGESRDPETAGTAIEAALTGHLVLTSLHANDAASAVVRLGEMGVEPFLVGSAVTCSVAQRLLRRVCPNCRTEYMPDHAAMLLLGLDPGETFLHGAGCDMCNGSGYRGRVGVYEVMTVTPKIRRLIYQNAPGHEITQVAKRDGMIGMREDALSKVRAGITTVEEVLRATPEDEAAA
ncbi:MAG: GspE/PulE family protein [Fimbriimonadaceae bacterium]|nr:GspE/PulE family protein [Fimbriimonadaceae bacterium]